MFKLTLPKYTLEEVCNSLEGFCSYGKVEAMSTLITQKGYQSVAEIGVFGGRSLLPMAYTMKCRGKGMVYGIDPYTVSDAIQDYGEDLNERTKQIDFEKVYEDIRKNISKFELEDHCTLLRKTSNEAVNEIPSIELLHIDGNHSYKNVASDLGNYVPKLVSGGILWMDDCDWVGVRQAIDEELAKGRLRLLGTQGSQLLAVKP